MSTIFVGVFYNLRATLRVEMLEFYKFAIFFKCLSVGYVLSLYCLYVILLRNKFKSSLTSTNKAMQTENHLKLFSL